MSKLVDKLSVWELHKALRHKLLYTTCNYTADEAEQLIGYLKDYQQQWRKRNNIPDVKPEYQLRRCGE